MLFIKRLLAVAISNLLYLRNVFPEVAFKQVKFKDMKSIILQTETFNNKSAIRVIDDLFKIFDALERGYSYEFILKIVWQDMREKNITETYNFKFSRCEENLILTMNT